MTAGLREVSCTSCGAMVDLDARVLSTSCPYCGSATVIRQTHAPHGEPRLVVPFSLTEDRARRAVREWSTKKLSRPRAIASGPSQARATYVPALLYSAVSETTFEAKIGYKRDLPSNRWALFLELLAALLTRNASRYTWKPLEGARTSWVADVLVSASTAITNDALHELEPFDLGRLERYAPALVAGWAAEVPSRPLADCQELARGEARSEAGSLLPGFMPGQRHKELSHATELGEEALDFVLVPVWSFVYERGPSEPPAHVYVNGQTGRVVTDGIPSARWPTYLAAILILVGALIAVTGAVPTWVGFLVALVGVALWLRR